VMRAAGGTPCWRFQADADEQIPTA
jgi:hypothetical protein